MFLHLLLSGTWSATRYMTITDPGFYGRPVTAGGSGCTRCPEGATASPGSLVASSCYCAFGYLTAPKNSSLTSNSSLTCLLSFSSADTLSRFVDLGNPGESCDQVCAATGRRCQAKPLQGVRAQSDVRQTLTAVDVSLASAFSPSASSTDLFTGLHAHYTASSWDATAGMWQDVSGNARHGVKTDSSWFNGNSDRSTKVTVAFTDPATARYVRIRPRTWTTHICMRAGLLIGKATEVVPYERLEYSSTFGNEVKGTGLHGQGMLDSPEAWCAASNDLNQWIKMDAGQVKVINGVVTQGHQPYDNWVTSHFIEISSDGNTWFSATLPKIFPVTSSSGNSTTGRIPAVTGASYSQVEFPSHTIPSVFTICSISRYSHACSPDSRNTFLTFFIKFFQHFIRMSCGLWLFSNCC